MSGFTYRKAEQSDLRIIAEAKKKSLREEWEWDEKTLEEIAEIFVDALRRGIALVCLAYNGAEFVGLGAVYIWDSGDSTLSDLYVLPEYRHNGVMHGLVNALIQDARERGCKSVWLISKNEEHRDHWKALGFRELYEENDEGVTELSSKMEMPLN